MGGNTSDQDFAMLVSVYGQEAGVVQMELMYNAKINEVAVAQRLIKRVTGNANLAQSLPGGFKTGSANPENGSSLCRTRSAQTVGLVWHYSNYSGQTGRDA